MRLLITIYSSTKKLIPFNYQPMLTGCIHKWIGKENVEHGEKSLLSFSFLQNVETKNSEGIYLKENSYFFISSPNEELQKKILSGITDDPRMFNDIQVKEVQILETPQFLKEQKFYTASPILLKKMVDNFQKHIIYSDDESEDMLTNSLKSKLEKANLSSNGLKVFFDKTYPNPKTKLMNYNKIKNKASVCPIIIQGSSEQIAFAWEVGIGHSTGIGFGALK